MTIEPTITTTIIIKIIIAITILTILIIIIIRRRIVKIDMIYNIWYSPLKDPLK